MADNIKTAPEPVLVVSGLTKSFGDNVVLDGVSLTVPKGQTVCLLGPSGSGKSTLLRCVNFLEKPDGGAIYLAGQRIGVREGGNVPMSMWLSSGLWKSEPREASRSNSCAMSVYLP